MATAPPSSARLRSRSAPAPTGVPERELGSPDRRPGSRPAGSSRAWIAVLLAVAPALGALGSVSWFLTQDAPAHVYNAEILARSSDPDSPFASIFAVRWQPIPNWAGHLVLATLLRFIPARLADRLMTATTLAGFALALFWLRMRVCEPGDARDRPARTGGIAQPRPDPAIRHLPAALLAALLAMNITWLMGFTSFLLGLCLFPITLGYWWPRRDRLGARGVVGLWLLLVVGYFCHMISLVMTVASLGVLAVATPLPARDRPEGDASGAGTAPADLKRSTRRQFIARLLPLALGFLPLIPLGLLYGELSHQGGPIRPRWKHLPDPRTLASWKEQLSWADPITLVRKDSLIFSDRVSPWFVALSPALWLIAALASWAAARLWWWSGQVRRRRDPGGGLDWRPPPASAGSDRRGWWILAGLLVLGGVVSPDTLGSGHGNYLPQRVVLCGLAALAVAVEIDAASWLGRFATGALAIAVALQSAIVWDYALHSDRTAGAIMRARDAVGRGRRVVYLPASVRGRFRANPLLHTGAWLGVGTDNIIWEDYETLYYYFPIQFRPGLDRPPADVLQQLALHDAPDEAAARARDWERLLARHANTIDVLVTYRSDPQLDAVTARYFREVARQGDVRVLGRSTEGTRTASAAGGSLSWPRP